MLPILTIALRAAKSAADKLNYTVANIANLTAEGATRKAVIDAAIEDATWRARKAIRTAHTRHHIHSDRIGNDDSRDWDGQSKWIIDVASGETNLQNCATGFLVNIALYSQDKIDCVAIVDPMTGDYITVSRGRGVQFNDRRLRSEYLPMNLATCAIETKDSELLGLWNDRVLDLRMTGCSLLNFINLAAGRVQVAIAQGMSPTDLASAMLLVQESGCLTSDTKGSPVKMDRGELMAATPRLFKQIMATR